VENVRHLSFGEPTYWPTDRNKLPDLVDFCITKGISLNHVFAKSCFEISSDHTQVLITLSFETSLCMPHPSICNKKTNWEAFRLLLTDHLNLNVPLKTTTDTEAAINTFTNLTQWAGWTSTPELSKVRLASNGPLFIKQKLLEKRRLRRTWLRFHPPYIKCQLNKATRELKHLPQTTTTPASSTTYKNSPLQHPLTSPYGKQLRR
jgi:hypothetical protein